MTSHRKRQFVLTLSLEKKKAEMENLSDDSNFYSNFVSMPWDDKKLITIEKKNAKKIYTKWELIQCQMDLLNPIFNFTDLINVIKSYNVILNENGEQISPPWKCLVLKKYFSNLDSNELKNFFCENGILSTIRNLVLRLKELVPHLKVLKKGTCCSVKLHQMQIASLLANAFMCTFPKEKNNCPSVNFNTLYESSSVSVLSYNVEKIKCIINYFWRIHKEQPMNNVSYHRLCIPDHKFPRWDKTNVELSSLIVDANKKIEDQHGFLQVDFANKYVGGGILGRGCVQEEIRFIICPELIIARLFTECLGDNESLVIVGAERFCNYSGYSKTFRFTGNYLDTTPLNETCHKKSYITAVDALCFHNFSEQFRESKILRELKKAYVGFKPFIESDTLPLATGNWGCGAFGGDPQLKSLIQLMASSQAGRNILYLTFGDVSLKRELEQLYNILKNNSINVGMLYRIVRLYQREKKANQTVFEFVREAVVEMKKMAPENEILKDQRTFEKAEEKMCDEKIFLVKSNYNALFQDMEINLDELEKKIPNQSVNFNSNINSDTVGENKFDAIWFENEIDLTNKISRNRRLVTQRDENIASCSPNLFFEAKDMQKLQETLQPCEQKKFISKVNLKEINCKHSKGKKRMIQKKITDCFLKKQSDA